MSETAPFYSEEADGMSKRTQLEEYFSQSLEIDLLLRLCPDDEDTIYQIVDLLVDTCATNRKLLRIAGDDKPAEVVRSRFMKLNADHIRFVLKCLAENSSPIRNMKQYLLASLYNAPTTMQLSSTRTKPTTTLRVVLRGGDTPQRACHSGLCTQAFFFFWKIFQTRAIPRAAHSYPE